MLLMPAHKGVVISLGPPQATPRPILRKGSGKSGPPAIPKTGKKASPPPVPQAAQPLRTYRSVRRAVLRVGFEMTSEKAANPVLEKNQTVKALEAKLNDEGILRVRMDGGWTSVSTADGKPVLVVVDTDAPSPFSSFPLAAAPPSSLSAF